MIEQAFFYQALGLHERRSEHAGGLGELLEKLFRLCVDHAEFVIDILHDFTLAVGVIGAGVEIILQAHAPDLFLDVFVVDDIAGGEVHVAVAGPLEIWHAIEAVALAGCILRAPVAHERME